MGNRSLDDFLDGEAGDDEPSDDNATAEAGEDRTGEGVVDEAETGDDRNAEVDPAASTYLGRAGECVACGETVERRWESDEGPVCPECKEW